MCIHPFFICSARTRWAWWAVIIQFLLIGIHYGQHSDKWRIVKIDYREQRLWTKHSPSQVGHSYLRWVLFSMHRTVFQDSVPALEIHPSSYTSPWTSQNSNVLKTQEFNIKTTIHFLVKFHLRELFPIFVRKNYLQFLNHTPKKPQGFPGVPRLFSPSFCSPASKGVRFWIWSEVLNRKVQASSKPRTLTSDRSEIGCLKHSKPVSPG